MPTVTPSAIGQFSLDETVTSLDLIYDIDFLSSALDGSLNDNNRALARYLERLHNAGDLDNDFAYLLHAPDAATYGAELDRLSPTSYAAVGTITQQSAGGLGDRLLSCREREGPYRFVAEGQCVRLDILGSWYDQEDNGENPGWTLQTSGVALGAQWEVREDLEIGFNVAYEPYTAEGDDDLWRSTADQVSAGFVLKHQIGDTALSLAIGGGFATSSIAATPHPTARHAATRTPATSPRSPASRTPSSAETPTSSPSPT